MLRGWDNPENPFENAPESPNGDLLSPNEAQQDNQSPDQSGQEAAILRDWTETNVEEEEKMEEDYEGDLNEIGIDPLSPAGDSSSVGAWSVAPGALDRTSFSVPYDYGNEDTKSPLYAEHNATSPRAGRSTKTSLNMSKDEIDQPSSPGATVFDDIDLEALADTLESPSSNRNNSRRCKGAWTKRFLYEVRTNPAFKFKLIVGGSVLVVATCLIAIAVTLSGGKSPKNNMSGGPISSVGAPVLEFTETQDQTQDQPTYFPTALHTTNPTDSPSNKAPTGSPSYHPTYEPTLVPSTAAPTGNPTPALTTASPSSDPTTLSPTYEPSMSPVTYSPTKNCADADGKWMTYNDKSRDCIWLDNGHNGAESARKDMNCLDSELGEKCRYTCRLYNGCMDYLLSSISDFIDTNDISVGDACADKEGLFLSQGGIPRNCTWMNEDPVTAPMKKNLNCGTPGNNQTELGAMCPATCVGYNDCEMTESGEIVKVEPTPIEEKLASDGEDVEDVNVGDDPETKQEDPIIRLDDIEDCFDEDGMWQNHLGKYRQCRWFFTDEFEVAEKQRLNCGITEIGRKCNEACGCGKLHAGFIDASSSGLEAENASNKKNKKTDDKEVECEDEEGEWLNHENMLRQCRWLDFDSEINAEAKKLLNCGKTEVGLKCKARCGCEDNAALQFTTACEDKKGLFKTHEGGDPRTCDWMDRKFPEERRELNCGKTEIGVMCQCKCSEPILDVTKEVRCEDEEGEWMTHESKWRQCRWLDFDSEINAEAKKLLNCGKTEIGLKCKETCGCGETEPMSETACEDKKGLFMTHEGGSPRMCDWMDRKFPVERRELNCGKTEIGVMCQCKCSEPIQVESFVDSPSLQQEQKSFASKQMSFVESLRENVIEQVRCEDEEGEWMTHESKWRQCRWLDFDSEINAEAKKLLNCGKTEIGLRCKETCGCGETEPMSETACEDKKGLFMTHEGGSPRMCDWMDRKFPVERRELNCGKTEIGVMCQCKCSEPILDVTKEVRCEDEAGEWMTHESKWRQCRWLDFDSEINAEAKKLLNCGKTEIGLRCKETCGCGETEPMSETACEDKKGLFMTHEGGSPRMCDWMDRKFPVERRELNCGKTEIGVMCQCKCSEPIQLETFSGGELMDTGYTEPLQGGYSKTCEDEEGEWLNNENKFRQCRWLNLENTEAKKLLNCGKTEIGLRCRETCGCGEALSLGTGPCQDYRGEWKTNEGDTRTCEWMDRKFPIERRQQNCGLTEIGVMCQCKCQELIQDTHELTGIRDFAQSTGSEFISLLETPTLPPDDDDGIRLRKHQGRLDETGKLMTIVAVEDATVSQRKDKVNYGDSIRLYVDSSQGAEMQALIVFDLSYVEQSISFIGRAALHIYARKGSPFGGVEFKKMFETEFRQGAIKWNNMLGDGASEPTIAFLDDVDDETWYEVDVTAAVRAAFLNGEERLGIRIVSSESHFSFASKDTDRFQPALVIDSRTNPPTNAPVPQPTPKPSPRPVIPLDCIDSKGFFVAHTGESKSCSWFDVGNSEQKKELNCKDNSEAAYFCQSQCSAYNGCDTITCDDKSGSYLSHTGLRERCPWLLTGAGTLKLEQNCGTSEYPITELGKRCQATCANYNGC